MLYTFFFQMILRQIDLGGRECSIVKHLFDFSDLVTPVVTASGWNLLGALGLGSAYVITPRARFLGLSLVLFIAVHVTKDKKLRLKARTQPE